MFWIGIGHAGTLISAILFLLRQKWRTSVNRAAEAMTLFAVACAGVFPLIHVGRIWYALWWLPPIPNNYDIWPQFRSPLLWDVFAVSTYGTVSLLFWYTGLIPDLATMRDRATGKVKRFLYGFFALGWTGSNRHWSNYEKAYLLLAGLSTPLVLSVHSIVSFDFAVSQLPGWHTTIFPPYFVAGAIFAGFSMVVIVLVAAGGAYGTFKYKNRTPAQLVEPNADTAMPFPPRAAPTACKGWWMSPIRCTRNFSAKARSVRSSDGSARRAWLYAMRSTTQSRQRSLRLPAATPGSPVRASIR